jgi:hypothetical protein
MTMLSFPAIGQPLCGWTPTWIHFRAVLIAIPFRTGSVAEKEMNLCVGRLIEFFNQT